MSASVRVGALAPAPALLWAGCRHLVRALWWLVWWLPWVEVIVAVAHPSGP